MSSFTQTAAVALACVTLGGCLLIPDRTGSSTATSPDTPVDTDTPPTETDTPTEPTPTDTATPTDTEDTGSEPPAFDAVIDGGGLGIDANGLFDWILGLYVFPSQLLLTLDDGDAPACDVTIEPAFLSFTSDDDDGQLFTEIRLDLGAGAVLDNACSLPDAFVLEELARVWGTLDIGFSEGATYPKLDVRLQPALGEVRILRDAGEGWPTNAAGIVLYGYNLPDGGPFERGVYIW